jgi:hypothetical protein
VYVAITAPTQPRCKSLGREKKQCTKELPKTLCKTLKAFKEKIAVLRWGVKENPNKSSTKTTEKNFKKKKKLPKKSWKQTTKRTLDHQHAETRNDKNDDDDRL